MRDAFGGVFMIRLMLVFVFIFVSFTAISLNYAKAFRIKNRVIDFIEQEEIFSLDTLFKDTKRLKKLEKILADSGYNKTCKNNDGKIATEDGLPTKYCYHGIVFEQADMIDRTIIYNIYSYAGWDLGSLNMILALGGQSQNSKNVIGGSWEISGEARVVLVKRKK